MKSLSFIGLTLAFSSAVFAQEEAEGSRGFIALTAAYSERYKETVGAEIIARNLFKSNIDLNLGGQRNDLGHQWSLDLRKNATIRGGSFPDESAFRLGIRGQEYAWDESLYQTKRSAVYAGFSYELAEDTRLVLDLESYRDELSNVSANASPLIQAEAGEVNSTGVAASFIYGTTDYTNIDRGTFFAQARTEFYGITGDAKWKAFSAKVAYAVPLNRSAKLKASVEGGIAEGRSGYSLRVTDRAFLSPNQLRGFQFGGVGPFDTDGTTVTPLGGRKFFASTLELEQDLVKIRGANVSASVFIDAGSVWDLNTVNGGDVDPIDDSFYMRQSAGIALNLNAGFGSLSISYAQPFRKRNEDRTQNLALTFRLGF